MENNNNIIITSDDMPITVAQKLITATKPAQSETLTKLSKALFGEDAIAKLDMFTTGELREIADYLYTYCDNHEDEE